MAGKSKTAKGRHDKLICQFSVFLENKVGRLLDLAKLLGSHHIHICGLTVIEMADAAVARIVVSDPDGARTAFHEAGIAFSECRVIGVELPFSSDQLEKILSALLEAEINIYFVYSMMIRPHEKEVLALSVEDEEMALDVLRRHEFTVLNQADISR